MSFLNSALLFVIGPLIALPLVIHLLSRRASRKLSFPSVKNLKVSMTRSAAIYRWRHWLLLILRSILLTFLILAFLQPLLHKNGSIATTADRVVLILIDNSLSMEHRSGGKTSRERAIDETERILNTLRGKDQVNIYSVAQDITSAFNQPSSDISMARNFSRSLETGVSKADFSKVNRQLGGISVEGETAIEIYYLSDYQRSDWANIDFRPLPSEARILFVDVGAHARGNRALTGMQIEGEATVGNLVTVEAEVANYSDTSREEKITLLMDARPVGEKTVYIAPNSISRATFPLALPDTGKHLIEVQSEEDALASDNHFFAVIDVQEKEEVLIITNSSEEPDAGIRYLEAALNPFLGIAGGIRPRRIDSENLSASDLASVTKLFISKSNTINEASAKLLADFLFSGGGIVWYLDSPNDPTNLARLDVALGDEDVALQLGDWRETTQLAAAQQIISGDFSSPFLKLFAGTRRQDLSRLEVYDNHVATRKNSGKSLLMFADGSPAMTIQEHGLGQLLLLNFSPDLQHSNLANQRFFPVWTQSIVGAFHGQSEQSIYHHVGERISTEVWRKDIKGSQFYNPNGKPVKADVETIGTRADIAFSAKLPGIYHLTSEGKLIAAFAVNLPAEEADLRPIEMDSLPERQGAPRQVTFLDSSKANFEHTTHGKPIFHWMIAGALLCALLELALQLLIRQHTPTVISKS